MIKNSFVKILNILLIVQQQITVGCSQEKRQMFKRCHSLKRSNINIKSFSKAKSNVKHPPNNIDGDKQNISYNINIKNYEPQLSKRTYTYQNAQLTKSIELSYVQTMCSSQQTYSLNPNKSIKTKNTNMQDTKKDEENNIGQIKKLCKDIDQLSGKITMYKEILRKKQVKHNKQKIDKIDQKQKILAMLIDLYQRQKAKNDQYKCQLIDMGVKDFDRDSLLYNYAVLGKNNLVKQNCNQEIRSNRRTTATFNYF